MSLGLGGWRGKDIGLSDADECDLSFWTFKEERQNGHVGALLRGQDREIRGHARKRTEGSGNGTPPWAAPAKTHKGTTIDNRRLKWMEQRFGGRQRQYG